MPIKLDEEKIRQAAQRLVNNNQPQEFSRTVRYSRQTQEPAGSSINMPISSVKRSARQQLLSQDTAASQTQSTWFKGNQPTNKEIMARIYEIGKTDQKRGQELFDQYNTLKMDPTSELYSPYEAATNKAVNEISKLGIDVSGGVDRKWIEANKDLLSYARFTTTGTEPAAPTSKSSAAENAAYWYWKIAKAEERTEKAETEWKALQEEVSYWAGRSDRNLSDDEILNKIDWSNYKTLVDMDEARSMGVPVQLNRSVGYSKDNLYGVIWAARNGGGTGDAQLDSVQYALGRGNGWKLDQNIRDRMDPTSGKYNPYSVGSTIDDAAEYFGVSEFDQAWLQQNRGLINSTDATAQRMYKKVYDAEQTTHAIESEMQELQRVLEEDLYPWTSDPDVILEDLFDDFKTLQKLDKSLESGDILATTRAVNFSKKQIQDEVMKHCLQKNSALQGTEYTDSLKESLGAKDNGTATGTAIVDGRDNQINAAGKEIAKNGTKAEKMIWKTSAHSNFDENTQQINAAIQDGSLDASQGYSYMMQSANNFAFSKYLPAAKIVSEYNSFKDHLSAILSELDNLNNAEIPDDEAAKEARDNARKELEREAAGIQSVLDGDQQKYEEAQSVINSVEEGYRNSERLAELTGVSNDEVQTATEMLDIVNIFAQPQVPSVTAYSVYDVARQNGKSFEEILPVAQRNKQEAYQNLASIETLEAWCAANNVELDEDYIRNINNAKTELRNDIKDASYFELRTQPDFVKTVETIRRDIDDKMIPHNFIEGFTKNFANDYSEHAVEAAQDSSRYHDRGRWINATQQEKDTYLYLLSKEGEKAAEEYYEYLFNDETGRINTRVGEQTVQQVMDMFGGSVDGKWEAVAGTAATVLAGPMRALGSIYTISQAIQGKQINPNHFMYSFGDAMDQVRAQSKESFVNSVDNSLAKKAIGLGYDVITGAADSAYSAMLTGGMGLSSIASGDTLAAKAINAAAGASLQGSYSVGTSYRDIVERGGTPTQAAIMAGISFACETATEAIEVSDIIEASNAKSIRALFERPFIQVLQLDDAAGEAISEWLEGKADDYFMKEKSDMNMRVRELQISEGMSKEDAEEQAAKEFYQRVGYAALSGAISAGITEGVGYLSVTGRRRAEQNAQQQNVQNNADDTTQDTANQAPEDLVDDSTVEPEQAENEAENAIPVAPAEDREQLSAEEMANAPEAQQMDGNVLSRQMVALQASMETEDISSRTSTLAAVLTGGNGEQDILSIAKAAAQHLINDFGENVPKIMQDILLTAEENGISQETVINAMTASSLSTGASHAVLGNMLTNEITAESINTLIESSEEDLQNPVILDDINAEVADNLIAEHVRDIVGEGGLAGLASYSSGVRQAKSNLNTAQENLDTAQRNYDASVKNMQTAEAEFMADPSNPQLMGSYQQAVKDAEGKAVVVQENEQSVQKNQENVREAQRILDEKADQEMTRIRQEATQRAAEQQEANAQAAAERAQQKEDARQTSNANTADTESFIEQYYPDATDEEKQKIRERFSNMQAEATDPEKIAARKRFVKRLGQKFGVNINVVDTSEGGTRQRINGSYQDDTNTITLDSTVTQTDAIYTIALHELTHRAERSGLYDQLASAIVKAAYTNDDGTYDENRLASDIRTKQQMYNAQLALMAKTDSTIDATPLTADDASKEIVADLTRKILFGDEASINKLVAADQSVAQRFLTGIKNFLRKIAGIDDPAVVQLRKTQQLFEKALKEVQKNRQRGTKTQYSLRSVNPVQPSSDAWVPGHSESWFRENGYPIYADVDAEQASAEGTAVDGHGTQIKTTKSTYRQLFDQIKKEHPDDYQNMHILDASSGLGIGTRLGQQMGFDVEDIEPFPSRKYGIDEDEFGAEPEGSHAPMYTDYSELEDMVKNGEAGQYDFIISNAVLNVIPQDTRDNLIVAMGNLLAPGGDMFVNVIDKSYAGAVKSDPTPQYKTTKSGKKVGVGSVRTQEGDYSTKGNTTGRGHETFVWGSNSVQKVFSFNELSAYIKDALGPGYSVKKAKLGMMGVMVHKDESAPSVQYSLPDTFDETQKKNANYNINQTEVGHDLKTLKGSKIGRSKYGVGKDMGGNLYVHKNYADRIVPAEALQKAQDILQENYPDFQYNAIKYDSKNGNIAFQEAPDFDTAREPVVGDYVTVNPDDGSVRKGHSDYVWHHKWEWVDNDYEGFDVGESWNWSKQWLSTLTEVADGNGIGRWNTQLDRFGLPQDNKHFTGANGEILATGFKDGTVAKTQYSFNTWNDTDKEKIKQQLIEAGYSSEEADNWINDVNSVAAQIAADPERLDYNANPDEVFMKPNMDYIVTLDASTLCAKRLLYQGTFNEIQKRMPNTVLLPEDLIDLTTMMKKEHYVTPCAICYVESRRQHLGKFAKRWLDEVYKGDYDVKLSDLTTTTGLAKLKEKHKDIHDSYLKWMKARGTANPKVVETRTEYNGDLHKLTPKQIENILKIGGLRVQSFSDFETPHLIDMMQAVMDMAVMKLTSQAYTKVPNFAWVFGDTGIKINLSLIGGQGGVDENGNLIFDDEEGMPHEEAFRIRERYSKNVGTILVGINDRHILAAMADDRIDFIIPFHRSGWSKEQLAKMPTMSAYDDYQEYQNEKRIIGRKTATKTFKSLDSKSAQDFMDQIWVTGRTIEETPKGYTVTLTGYDYESLSESDGGNFSPVAGTPDNPTGYWDFDKTGKENAEKYLQMCKDAHRLPKFWEFLVDNGNGSFSLQPDGSTDGYWKTLIDFKMYDNDGKGSPQQAVKPIFNKKEVDRVLGEYKGGANELPVAMDIVDEFEAEYKRTHPREQYSLPVTEEMDEQYMQAVNSGDTEIAQSLVERAARNAGYNTIAETNTIPASQIVPVNGTESDHVEDIEKTLENGWQGRPILVYDAGGYTQALTGSHRIAAAKNLGIDVPVVELDSDQIAEFEEFLNDEYGSTFRDFDYGDDYMKADLLSAAVSSGIESLRDAASLMEEESASDDAAYSGNGDNRNALIKNPGIQGSSVKSMDAITYDDNGNFIPLSQRFNPASRDIRYSLPSDDILDEQIRRYLSGSLGTYGAPLNNVQYARNSQAAPTAPQSTANNPQQQTPKGAPKNSPYVIAKDLLKNIGGVGDYMGTKRLNANQRGVLGYYQTREKYIAVPPKEAGVFTTTMHEIGHAIADKVNMTGTQQMVNNLLNIDPRFSQYSAAELPGEAFAEFTWRYMENEQRARQFAGDAFVNQFEDALRSAGLSKDVHDAANQLRMWVNASTNEKIGATIKRKSDTKKDPIRDRIRHAIASIVDATSAAEAVNHEIRKQSGQRKVDLDEDIRSNALAANFASRKASALLTESLRDTQNNEIGESLTAAWERIGLKGEKDFELLSRYMLAKHSLARDAQGKPVFDADNITEAERQAFIADIDQNNTKIKEAAQAFQDYRKAFLQAWMVDTGFITQEFFDWMNDTYPDYVPTYRVQDGNGGRSGLSKSGYKIKTATGSTQDILNPIESFAEIVSSVVNMVSTNNTKLAWHNAFQTYDGMGVFGRALRTDKQLKTMDMRAVQDKVEQILQTQVSTDVMDAVLKAIGEKQTRLIDTGTVNMENVIDVQLPNGDKVFYEIADPDLFKLLSAAGSRSDDAVRLMSQTFGRLTRGMSALTTGSNPIFAIRNFLRDYQNSVNWGSWASNYITGSVKWLAAAYDVWNKKGQYNDYVALGGGGWTRVNTTDVESANELRGNLVKGADGKNIAKKVGNALWSGVTLERLNETIEQASRYAEYKYGKHDKSTYEGQIEAFLAAQEATVDFARSGNSNIMPMMKQLIPFIGASTQGVYRTGRFFTEAERDRMPVRFAKTFLNTALTSALCAGLLLRNLKDEDKEAFEYMSDDLKAQHFYLPNFAPNVFGNRPLIRIPVAQDPFMYAVHGAVTNAMWHGTTDENIIDIATIADTIIDNLNVVSGGPVWSAMSDVAKNRSWFGNRITPTRMDSWESSTRYTEETPDIFITGSRWINRLLDQAGASQDTKNLVSPLNLQYLAEQYTGFVGQLAIPAITKNKNGSNKDAMEMLMSAVAAAQNRLTTDPRVSNEVVSAFYDGTTMITQVTTAVKNDRPLNFLNPSLTSAQASQAYDDAKALTGKGGILAETKAFISEKYAEIDQINGNDTLSDDQKYKLTSDCRMEMIREALKANEVIQDYREKYVTGQELSLRVLAEGAYGHIPTADETMPQTFQNDMSQPYMQKAMEVYQATNKDSALPHPSFKFSANHVEYEVAPEQQEMYTNKYKTAYNKALSKYNSKWSIMTNDEKLDALSSAHRSGHEAAKKWYLSVNKGR